MFLPDSESGIFSRQPIDPYLGVICPSGNHLPVAPSAGLPRQMPAHPFPAAGLSVTMANLEAGSFSSWDFPGHGISPLHLLFETRDYRRTPVRRLATRLLFPRTARDTSTRGITRWGQDQRGKIYAMPTQTIHKGHSGVTKVPYVCAGCNNGWMSRIEMRTRPFLMPLIQGLPRSINTFDLKVLATWITKTVMVGEYMHPDHVATPDAERLHMYANLEPPDNWAIYIADYRGSKWRNLAMSHHIAKLLPPRPTEPSDSKAPDTHFTSIGMGHLFIQVASSAGEIEFENDAFRKIWPSNKLALSWPPARAIHDTEADYVANSLTRISNLPLAASI